MKRYIFKRNSRNPFARKMLLAGVAGCTVVMANTLPIDVPAFTMSGKSATAATSPGRIINDVVDTGAKKDVYLTTGFLDGLLVDRPYDAAPQRAMHIPEISDEYI